MLGILPLPPRRDLVLGFALAAAALVELAVGATGLSVVTPGHVVSALLVTLPLMFRAKAPVAVGLGVQTAFALSTAWLVPAESLVVALTVFILATYTIALGPRTWWGSAAAGCASAVLLIVQGLLDVRFEDADAVVNVVYAAMVWGVAAVVREHAHRAARSEATAVSALQEASARAEAAVQAERQRVAAELHDVVAHALSIIVVRSRGALHEVRADPDAAAPALRDVEQVAASALSDMRRLLALVHDVSDPSPAPTLQDLPRLVLGTDGAGLRAHLEIEGHPRPTTPGFELSAYRVVQEALTNAVRHAGGGTASVRLRWLPDRLVVDVEDDGPGSGDGSGTGRGLVGMRDRVELFGGTFDAGPRPGGGFAVRVNLPIA